MVIRIRARRRYFNLVTWPTSSSRRTPPAAAAFCLAEKLLRYDLIAIAELGYPPFSQPCGQLLLHLIRNSKAFLCT